MLTFVKKVTRTEWVSAPLYVPKNPPLMYRLTVNYRPINVATIKNKWPMPHVDAVFQYMCGAEAFSAIDFTSGYRQLPMNLESQAVHEFTTLMIPCSRKVPRKEVATVQPNFRPVCIYASASCVTASYLGQMTLRFIIALKQYFYIYWSDSYRYVNSIFLWLLYRIRPFLQQKSNGSVA